MDTIGVVSILEDKPYKDVKNLWKLFEKEFSSVGVQTFNHPHIAFQAGKTETFRQLKKDFQKIVPNIKPFNIEVNETRHFDKQVIYLKVGKTAELIRINKLINQFLKIHCQSLFEYYTPKNWVPHITLAMDDLTEENFEKAWSQLKHSKIKFKQKLHNICIVKWHPNGKIGIAKKYAL
jgi:2'-5' RNA ligase